MSVTITEIVEALDGKPAGSGFTCHCPAHDDGAASLSIAEADGRLLVHCHAGCTQANVIAALKERNLWPTGTNGKRNGGGRSEVCRYDYTDSEGNLRYQVVRFEPKDFRQFDAVRKVWNLKAVDRVPYRLPEVLQAIKDNKGIFLVEGEKDVEGLRALGLVATTNQGGTGSKGLWQTFAKKYFKADARVYIVPDCDDPGQLLAADAARALNAAGCEVKRVNLPYSITKNHGKDVSDWLAEGHTRDELIALATAAPVWAAVSAPPAEQRENVQVLPSSVEEGVVQKLRRIAKERRGDVDAAAPRDTGTGNAQVFTILAKGMMKCVPSWGWLFYDGKRWARDDVGMRFELGKIVGEVRQDMLAQGDPNTLRERVRFVQRSLSGTGIRETVFLSESSPCLIARPGDFDINPMLFNCATGTINLSTLELLPHTAEDMLTRISPVEYRPEATCPTFDRFMSEIACGEEDLLRFKKRWAGYMMSGDTSEQCFKIGHGTGSNGKGTEDYAFELVLGEYATSTPASTFLEKRNGESSTNDLAALVGVRAVFASETGQNEALAESKVKQLTGEDIITCRFLFKEYFSFKPGFKLNMETNHKPRIRGNNHAIWRRVRLVPYNRTFSPEERDLHLREKLQAEASGILNWMLAGFQDWLEHGLGESETVTNATSEYQVAEDRFAEFIEAECVCGPGTECFSSDLYSAYMVWAERNHERTASQKAFSEGMVERGFAKRPTKMGKVFSGIEPKSSGRGDG
jgi:putative DNA primase/helicase